MATAPLPESCPAPGRPRNTAIDVLRAGCILYIVGYWHLVPYTEAFPGYANAATECLKDIALGSFVFCSGLLLAGRRMGWDRASLTAFYLRRVVRIYPLYALALLLFGLTGLAEHDVIVKALLLSSMFQPPAPYTLWFVSMIMVFYLMTPLWTRLAKRPTYFLVGGMLLLASSVLVHAQVQALDTRIIQYLPCFLLGIACARIAGLARALSARAMLLVLFIPAFLLYRVQYGAEPVAALARIPAILIGTLLLFRIASLQAGRFGTPAVLRLAYASFCVYLFHRVIFQWSIALYYPAAGAARLAYLLAIVLPATLVVAYYLQRAYDRGVQILLREMPATNRSA